MTTTVEAIYESGLLRLLAPMELPEGAHVQVTVTSDASQSNNGSMSEKKSLYEIALEIAAMPDEGAAEGFSGTDHDRILYA